MEAKIDAESIVGEQREVFRYDSNILPYFITPASLISFLAAFLSAYLLSPLFWSILLPANKNPPRSNMYFHTMLGSTLHAVVAISLFVYLMAYGLMATNRVFSKSPLGFTAMQISLGYLLGDLIICLIDPELRHHTGFIVHHIAGIVGISLSLFHQGKLMFFVVYRLIAECSTPFVNLRYILSDLGIKDGSSYLFAGISMLISFILCRIVVLPWHWYELLTCVMTEEATELVPLFFKFWLGFNYLVFDVLNVYWTYKMIRGLLKLIKAKRKSN